MSETSKANISKLTATTSVMNRKPFLERSLQNWIKYPLKEIIVLDWGSTDGAKEMIMSIKDERIKYFRIEADMYKHSAARNIKMALASRNIGDKDFILSIDSDIYLNSNFLDKVFLDSRFFYSILKKFALDGITGTSVFTKEQFFSVKGCNEAMEGWGFEDLDLYRRLEEKYKQVGLNPTSLYHQQHSDELRVAHTISKKKWVSNYDNKILAMKNHIFNADNFEILDANDNLIYSKELLAPYEKEKA